MRTQRSRILMMAVWCGSLFPPLAAQSASWRQVLAAGPAARGWHAMAYDSQRGRTVLFGGGSGNVQWPNTWEWDGSTWTQVATTGPVSRDSHAMAYDRQRGRIVLFGGYAIGPLYFADTWEWNGSAWTQVAVAGPSARAAHAMAYDSQRARTVLFGGSAGTSVGQADTWEWDGTTWLLLAVGSAPVGRAGHAMAYDSQRGKTVLFGGGNLGGYLGDTWQWDGSVWAQVATIGPAVRQAAMAYDSARGKTVLFGGYTWASGHVLHGDTWEWDGSAWTQVATIGPAARGFHALAYDSQSGLTVLFGGLAQQSLGDTWEWGGPGSASVFGNGCGSPALALVPVANARPVINTTARVSLTNIPSSLAFVALGWSRTMLGPVALPLALAGHGMPGCDLLQSCDATASTVPTGPGTATFSLPLPNWSGLLGLSVYLQAWAAAPGTNAGNTIVSNGVEWVIGNS